MNPLLISWGLRLGIVVAAALGGFFYGHHVESLAFDAYRAEQAATAEKQLATEQAHARAVEQAAVAHQAAAEAQYQENLNELKKRRDALLAAGIAGGQRLYVTTARAKPAGVPQPAASASGADTPVPAALSDGSASFFIDKFAEADQLVATLNLAEQVIAEDRKTCNGGGQ
ncbi:lysis system i-spanin subunit Rz [Paraburkholderia kururiensis]|uniref:lysis system i-spanin subunit Rz n=1 Tax=Paraburkholderia kururiensis TaxID=984307 RepID=UPI00034B3AB5|nr:lysis system i-spanin subunit Rz [Paraburkholderia kururiensis]